MPVPDFRLADAAAVRCFNWAVTLIAFNGSKREVFVVAPDEESACEWALYINPGFVEARV